MRIPTRLIRVVFILTLFTTLAAIAEPAGAAAVHQMAPPAVYSGVFTYHYDNGRTGANTNEFTLTPANVNPASFGKIGRLAVDGYVYAQPLYVRNVEIPGKGVHNVVYVATEHDSVYAFDASGRVPAPLWHRSFIDPEAGVTTVTSDAVGTLDIRPEIGITSTPVIDPSGTLYVVAKTQEAGLYVQRLHALDIATGAERPGSPRIIAPTISGSGAGAAMDGIIAFNALRENQRAALAEVGGKIYIAFASHGDHPPFHGWVLGYDAKTLALTDVFNDTPNGADGGIWQGANGPAADATGSIYVSSGNGTFDADTGGPDYGDSVIKLAETTVKGRRQFRVTDFFTPYEQNEFSESDLDFGPTGTIVLPDQRTGPKHLLFVGTKVGTAYLLDRDNLGRYNPDDDSQIVQEVPSMLGMTYTPGAFFNDTFYFGPQNRPLLAFPLVKGQFNVDGEMTTGNPFGYPGVVPSISSNGRKNGIVWALQIDQFLSHGPAVLYAYDAANLNELYDSELAGKRDIAGPAVKFTTPMVADGRVYIGTQNSVDVYGLLAR
jgi:outer membrane protein assembly factor BamB